MTFLLIFLYSYINIEANLLNKHPFIEDYVFVHGRCFDVHTGENIVIKGRAIDKLNASVNFTSNTSGVFDFKLPVSAKSIVFESNGYTTVNLPTVVINNHKHVQNFLINIPMSNIDSLEVVHPNYLFLSFSIIDSIEVNYKISSIKNPSNTIIFNFRPGETKNTHTFERLNEVGNYTFVGSTMDDRIIFSEIFSLQKGLNFMDVIVKNNIKGASENSENTLDRIEHEKQYQLDFDQSQFALKDSAKLVLNRLVSFLKGNSDAIIEIIGHTDNAGKETLNVTLSEYRAKVVAKYLEQKGVVSNRMVVRWKGSGAPLFPNDTEINRKMNRRVELHIKKNN